MNKRTLWSQRTDKNTTTSITTNNNNDEDVDGMMMARLPSRGDETTTTTTATRMAQHQPITAGIAPDAPAAPKGGGSSGIPRMKKTMILWYLALTASNRILNLLLSDSGTYLKPKAELCKVRSYLNKNGVCSREDVAAFMITCLIPMCYVVFKSITVWHFQCHNNSLLQRNNNNNNNSSSSSSSMEGRMFDRIQEAEDILAVQLVLSVYFMIGSTPMTMTSLNGGHLFGLRILYSSVYAYLCWGSLHYQYMHYYSVFFLGAASIIHINVLFLVLTDSFSSATPKNEGSMVDQVLRMIDSVDFTLPIVIVYRAIIWGKLSIQLLRDFVRARRQGLIREYRPETKYFSWIYVLLNAFVGFYQILAIVVLCILLATEVL